MLFSFRHSNFIPLVPIVICFGVWVQVLFLFRHSTWRKPVGGRRYCRAGYASLSSVCTNYARRLSMPDETVETRPPWLDFSLPRRPCLGISVLHSIILQTLNSCAIRPPDSTACPTTCFRHLHHRPAKLRQCILLHS